ncbi:MAG: alpha/beta hydrolase [Gammaproteobacteria bacterium]
MWNKIRLALFAFAMFLPATTVAQWPATPPDEAPADWGPVGINLEEIDYPYPVHYLELTRYGQQVRLAYMDIPARGRPNGQTVFWQHGNNFYSEAYTSSLDILADAGFRVLAVDRLGYGKSSKPLIPYNANMVAANMKALLDELGIAEVAIVGHSMGGMVVSRFAMLYPEVTTHVAMVNQIGLTDSRQGRPWRDPLSSEPGTPTYLGILRGHQRYYIDFWPPQQLEYVRRQYGQTLSGGYPQYARVRQMVGAMLYDDPVVYDWQHISSKALVIGGANDPLARNFAELAHNVADQLPNGTILLYEGIGHNPHLRIPEQFHADLIRFLESDPDQPASEWR